MKNKSILLFFSVSVIGGAETNFIKISKELKKNGFKIYLALVTDNGPLIKLIEPNIENHIVLDFRNLFHLPKAVLNYKKFISENKINTVLNFGLKVEIFSRLFSKILGIKFVISNIRSTDDWRKFHHVILDRCTQFAVDKWVANSIAGKNAFVKREKIKPNNCEVIYNFIDDALPNFKSNNFHSERIRIGVLSNIKQGKGFYDLIKLCRLFKSNKLNITFIIAGKDLLDGQFQSEIEKSGLQQYFLFKGYISDKLKFFDEIDVFLLPSYYEGLPTSILEAMQYGKPIVATDVGGIPEMIIDNYNGFLTKPGDISGFYNAINKLYIDPKLSEEFIINSFKVLKNNFVKSKVMGKWIQILAS